MYVFLYVYYAFVFIFCCVSYACVTVGLLKVCLLRMRKRHYVYWLFLSNRLSPTGVELRSNLPDHHAAVPCLRRTTGADAGQLQPGQCNGERMRK